MPDAVLKAIQESMNRHFEDDQKNFSMIAKSLADLSVKFDDHTANFQQHKADQEKARLEMKGEYMELKLANKDLSTKIDPVVDMFSNLKWGNKVLLKVGGVIGGLIGLSLAVLEIIKIIIGLRR